MFAGSKQCQLQSLFMRKLSYWQVQFMSNLVIYVIRVIYGLEKFLSDCIFTFSSNRIEILLNLRIVTVLSHIV